jgi:hypothetical protein
MTIAISAYTLDEFKFTALMTSNGHMAARVYPHYGEAILHALNNHDELVRRYRDALLFIESCGGEVTASYTAGGNLADNLAYVNSLKKVTW